MKSNLCKYKSNVLTRRDALRQMGSGFGMLAFANMVGSSVLQGQQAGLHHPAKAKRIIFLFMNGGVSAVDTFDPKPMLDKYDGHPLPSGEVKTERKTGNLMKSPFTFSQHGESGIWLSELWPHLGEVADEMCVINSMQTDIPNHEPSLLMMNTGHIQPGRPSMGAWLTYGLGTENENLPGFVVLSPNQPTVVGPPLWSNGFVPAVHQGTFISDKEPKRDKDFDPETLIPYIKNQYTDPETQRSELDLLQEINKMHMAREAPGELALEASIKNLETAYRMQTEAPEVFDIRKESEETQKMYGPGSTARGALMAVRLIEKGVRMVQVYYDKGDPWDAHTDIFKHRDNAKDSDQPFAAVIKDLKGRGLLDETIVLCATEFGRTPVVEVGGGGGSLKNGRDHNPFGFSVWLAGGGFKGGMRYGKTDDFGFKAIENPVHVHDLHATILWQMGIDHKRLTYRYSGRDFRLTDVAGNVVHDIIS